MKTVHRFGLAAGFVLLGIVVSAVSMPSLPDPIVTNWNAAGEPNGTMPRGQALWLLPALTAGLLALFAVIPRIDPLKENISAFRPYYDWLVVIFTAYVVVVHAGIIAFNLGYEFDFTTLLLAGTAPLFYYLGILLTHAERNWFVGIRTPWTLSSEAVWNRTHQLGGRLFKLTAILSAIGLLFGEYAVYFLIVPALSSTVTAVAYSYYLYERTGQTTESPSDTGV